MEENKAEVKIMKGGPYVISGDIKLVMPNGIEKELIGKTYFCRCGQSKNKPFCDGAHKQVEFDLE